MVTVGTQACGLRVSENKAFAMLRLMMLPTRAVRTPGARAQLPSVLLCVMPQPPPAQRRLARWLGSTKATAEPADVNLVRHQIRPGSGTKNLGAPSQPVQIETRKQEEVTGPPGYQGAVVSVTGTGAILLENQQLTTHDFLALIESLEPKLVASDKFSPSFSDDGDWDGSIFLYTSEKYETSYGTFTIRISIEESEDTMSIYSTDKSRGQSEIMSKIIDIMKASGCFEFS